MVAAAEVVVVMVMMMMVVVVQCDDAHFKRVNYHNYDNSTVNYHNYDNSTNQKAPPGAAVADVGLSQWHALARQTIFLQKLSSEYVYAVMHTQWVNCDNVLCNYVRRYYWLILFVHKNTTQIVHTPYTNLTTNLSLLYIKI